MTFSIVNYDFEYRERERVKLLWAALQVATQKRKLGVSLVCHGCQRFLIHWRPWMTPGSWLSLSSLTYGYYRTMYNWAVHNNMFFNSEKFHYISFSSSLSSNSYNVYANPNMEIINPSDNVLDLGIFMSSNCSFEFHIQNLCKKKS